MVICDGRTKDIFTLKITRFFFILFYSSLFYFKHKINIMTGSLQLVQSSAICLPAVNQQSTHTLQFMHTQLNFILVWCSVLNSPLAFTFHRLWLSQCVPADIYVPHRFFFFSTSSTVVDLSRSSSFHYCQEQQNVFRQPGNIMPLPLQYFSFIFFFYISFNLNYGKPLCSTHFVL